MIDDSRLDDVLASIGPLLVLDAAPAAVAAPTAGRARNRRRWLLGGAIAATVTIAGVSPLRGAVADWLGIGSTQVTVRPDADAVPVSLPGLADGATPISRRQAETRLEPRLLDRLDDAALGEPAGFAVPPEGGVLVAWPDLTTLWVHGAALDAGGWLAKLVAGDQQVQRVDGLGDGALAVIGDHVLETPERTVGAGTTVLWTRGETELRLAGDHPVDELVAIARELDGG